MHFALQLRDIIIKNLALFFRQFIGLNHKGNEPIRHFYEIFYFLSHTLHGTAEAAAANWSFPWHKSFAMLSSVIKERSKYLWAMALIVAVTGSVYRFGYADNASSRFLLSRRRHRSHFHHPRRQFQYRPLQSHPPNRNQFLRVNLQRVPCHLFPNKGGDRTP